MAIKKKVVAKKKPVVKADIGLPKYLPKLPPLLMPDLPYVKANLKAKPKATGKPKALPAQPAAQSSITAVRKPLVSKSRPRTVEPKKTRPRIEELPAIDAKASAKRNAKTVKNIRKAQKYNKSFTTGP